MFYPITKIPGRSKKVPSTWYMVHGTWYMVYGILQKQKSYFVRCGQILSDFVRFCQIWYPWCLAAIFFVVIFGQILSDFVRFCHILSDLVPLVPSGNFCFVRFGQIWSGFVRFGRIWSDLVRFGTLGT